MATNTARKYNTQDASIYDHQYRVITGRKKRRLANMFRSGMFLAMSLLVLAVSITYYLSLQADLTSASKNVAHMESQLNSLKLDNDENYSRINSSINLDEVRRIAIQELGMQYADEGQIISFNGEGSDYVRQLGALPSGRK